MALISTAETRTIVDSIAKPWLHNLGRRIVRMTEEYLRLTGAKNRSVSLHTYHGMEVGINGKSPHASFTAFDYRVKVPPGGFRPRPQAKAIFLGDKPVEIKPYRARTYTQTRNLIRRKGWMSLGFELNLIDFGVCAEINGPYGDEIEFLHPEPRLTIHGEQQLRSLGLNIGIGCAELIIRNIRMRLAGTGYHVDVLGPMVVTHIIGT